MAKTKYTIRVTLEHTWTTFEDIDVEVVAEDPDDAKHMAIDMTEDKSDPDSFSAELDETRVSKTKILSESPDYTEETWSVPRCADTLDMFTKQGL